MLQKKIVSQQEKSDSREFNKIQLKYWYISKKLLMIIDHVNCRQQEEPAILISRLLLRMRRMYEASICLDFH